VQNIGGIGNLTAIPPRATPDDVVAFDTGPGNMVIDAIAERLFDRPYDRNGRLAAKGEPIESVVSQLARRSFFRQKPPKTAGREQFGQQFALELMRLCRRADHHDVIATATALTARSIGNAVRDIVLPMDADSMPTISRWPSRYRQFIVSGGGTRNTTLMRMIREELAPLKIQVRTTDDFGMHSVAKEAVAFVLLAYQTWRQLT
jgi:anhydro-N-acetylmuramic acid kinase